MKNRNYTSIIKYVVKVHCLTPLHVGSGNTADGSVLIHPVSGLPFIQASSITGMLRAVSEKLNGKVCTNEIFGSEEFLENSNAYSYSSAVILTDGTFDDDCLMELRPRVSIDYKTGSAASKELSGTSSSSGQNFYTELIAENSKFEFNAYLCDVVHQKDFEKVLSCLFKGQTQIGGQKNNGNGFIKITSVLSKKFDLTQASDRVLWREEDTLEQNVYSEMKNTSDEIKDNTFKYCITVSGKTEGELLTKGLSISYDTKGNEYTENIKNASGRYMISGSSIKGCLRNRAQYIADRLQCKDLVSYCFGGEDKHRAGIIVVKDSVVSVNENDLVERHRIHIDKFTGGVIDGSLFTEKNIFGKVEFNIYIKPSKYEDAALGLMMFVLRDLNSGLFNLGSGYSVGKGFIDVGSITVKTSDNDELQICIHDQKIEDNANIMKNAMSAIERLKA